MARAVRDIRNYLSGQNPGKRTLPMPSRAIRLTFEVTLMIGVASFVVAQDNGTPQSSAQKQLQHIHGPRSIDQELAHLTKDLELTPKQQQIVRPLLQEHHDKIQALLDKNSNASRRELAPKIHAIAHVCSQRRRFYSHDCGPRSRPWCTGVVSRRLIPSILSPRRVTRTFYWRSWLGIGDRATSCEISWR